MSKFKNKKALALSVGAIMAGVSVIGVAAACAPTKAKPNKPTEKKVEQPQTSGNESSNPGSGSTTNPSGQGSNNGGTTNPTSGSSKTSPEKTQPSTPETTPKNDNGTSGDNKQDDKSKEMMQGDVSTPGSQNGEQPKVESGDGKTENAKTEQPIEGSNSQSGKKTEEGNSQTETGKPQPDPQTNSTENQQSGSQPSKKADESNSQTETGKPQPNPQANSTENAQPGMKAEDPDKQKEMDLKSKLTLVTFSRQQSYFWLRLNTSKETFDKLKDGRLKFLLDKGNGTFEEQASLFEQGGRKAYYVNDKVEADGSVSFSISSDQPYGGNQNEKGKYKVTQIWLLGDDSKNNLLNQNNKTVDVQ
ncbi:hypothetical protein [Ureaplasma diversum]|uniref:Lipoprotein n=1 Tax=Ureaplasma diversum NCTC 246 TaxID=1188241 RepID=A0A084EZC8_9BACT|nr:hypothetical protein [Ureaplasma diversum]KEZ23320.1 Hypothetical protein, predicted lipoprotein [Ureaplasma diversum NCTC 246]